MKNNKFFAVFVITVFAAVFMAACSPRAVSGQPESPSIMPSEESPVEELPAQETLSSSTLGSCYNPFYPVMEGKIWKYTMSAGGETNTMETSFKDVTSSSFTTVQQFTDISTETQWTCSDEGLLSNQFVNMSIPQIPELTYETIEVKGVVFPNKDLWQVGYSWDTEYVIKVRFASGETAFEGEGKMLMANEITATELVTVAAGSFNDAFRVEITGEIKMNIMGMENSIPITSTNWFVRDVGLVKSLSADPTLGFSMELTALE